MWPDLLKNYTTFGAVPNQATVGLSGSAEGLLSGGVEGLLLGGQRFTCSFRATNSDGFQPLRFRLTTLSATSAA
jgi:hypothetical protein